MEYALLRSLRALGPGLIFLGYTDLFLIYVLGEKAIFWPLDTARILIIGYVFGGVYGAFASIFRRDFFAFKGVQDNLMAALAKVDSSVSTRSWKGDVSPCFYQMIDNDNSLGQKSKGIYFNGFIVTTSFDAVWISVMAAIVGCIALPFVPSWCFIAISAAVAGSSYLVWKFSVARHFKLGEEQVLVIRKRFAIQFCDCLAERSNKSKN